MFKKIDPGKAWGGFLLEQKTFALNLAYCSIKKSVRSANGIGKLIMLGLYCSVSFTLVKKLQDANIPQIFEEEKN
jgi:hypothetical protein